MEKAGAFSPPGDRTAAVRYALGAAGRSLLRARRLNAVVLLSLFFGLIGTHLAFLNNNVFFSQLGTIRLAGADTAVYASLTAPAGLSAQALAEAAGSGFSAVSATYRDSFTPLPASLNGKAFDISLTGAYPGLSAFAPYKLASGRFPTDGELASGAAVCAVSELFLLNHALSASPGDILTVGGEKLTVVGVFRSFHLTGDVLAPYARAGGGDNASYSVYLRAEGKDPDLAAARQSIAAAFGRTPSRVLTGAELYAEDMRFSAATLARVFLIGGTLLAFAVWNIALILTGKLEEQKHRLGVEMALGAGKWTLFGGFFFENMLLALIANAGVNLVSPVLARFAPRGVQLVFGWEVSAATLLVSLAAVCLLSLFLTRRTVRLGIPAALEGGA